VSEVAGLEDTCGLHSRCGGKETTFDTFIAMLTNMPAAAAGIGDGGRIVHRYHTSIDSVRRIRQVMRGLLRLSLSRPYFPGVGAVTKPSNPQISKMVSSVRERITATLKNSKDSARLPA